MSVERLREAFAVRHARTHIDVQTYERTYIHVFKCNYAYVCILKCMYLCEIALLVGTIKA